MTASKTWIEIAEEFEDFSEISEAKFVRRRVWRMVKGELKKIIKKECRDSSGKAPGWKVKGTKCVKMNPDEILKKKKGARKATRKKKIRSKAIQRNRLIITKKKIAKGLIDRSALNREDK